MVGVDCQVRSSPARRVPPGRGGPPGWRAGRRGPRGQVAALGGAGGARVNPPLPRPPAFPFPRLPRADPRLLLSPPPAAAAAVVTHPAACPACPPRRGACRAGRAGTGGRLLTTATAAMLAARPHHWGPHRAPAPRGPRASPDPGRGRRLGEGPGVGGPLWWGRGFVGELQERGIVECKA